MFIADCDHDEVKREASRLLKSLDVKHRFKKLDLKSSDKREGDGVFQIRLEKLRQKRVKLIQYDHSVTVPAFLVDSCEYLRDIIDTDGLFRKPGVKMRQRELKKMLLSGGRLTADDHNPADVADLLKLFFRELPEPCIPYFFHDILQRCLDVKEKQNDAIFVTLLMLPTEYLYTLAYLMQFLQEVASHQLSNRMDPINLAIVWTPNLMPFKAGVASDKQMLNKRLTIVQLLIEHSRLIGVVPDCLMEHLSWHPSCSSSSTNELESSRHREKKKRRSGSLTRMLSGIRKMVHKRGSDEYQSGQVTPDQASAVPHTPRIMSTGKKRKASESNLLSFSAKKRKDLLELLPQGHLLPDVCSTTHLTPRVLVAQQASRNCTQEETQPKRRSRFYTCSKTPDCDEKRKSTVRSVSGSRLRLSHFGLGRKSKKKTQGMEESGQELSASRNNLDLSSSPEDYVRIPRTEYEEIKNRMSIIESRISSEFENIVGVSMSDLEMTPDVSSRRSLRTVQSAYEKTLESAEKLNSPTSDELARRFSRELKIRGSSERKVIRSPSARKIGSLRRRSKENVSQVKRNLSLNISDKWNTTHQFYPTNSLRRGKPNTVSNGLPEPFLMSLDSSKNYLKNLTNHLKLETFESPRENHSEKTVLLASEFDFNSFGVLTRSQARRASSFHGCDLSKVPTTPTSVKHTETQYTDEETTEWKNAEDFLKEEKIEDKVVTGRPSVARLRSQNAGMVLAKAKLFSTMVEPDRVTNVPNEKKSRELKKRNSSKSSKERKIQRKDSRNNRKSRKDNSVLKNGPSDTFSNGENSALLTQRGNTQSIYKENMSTYDLLNKHSLENRQSIQNHLKENLKMKVVSRKHLSQVVSPLKDRNGFNSPVFSGRIPSQPIGKINVLGRSPKVASKDGKITSRSLYSTPRKSPRQIFLKSQHLAKP